ncbi:MAG: DUF3306 domain-containing protein [Granulosicoccus sp.]
MTDQTKDPGFLRRWSTRKREAANSSTIEDWPNKEAPIELSFPDIDVDAGISPLTSVEKTHQDSEQVSAQPIEEVDAETEPLLTDADMPPIESLTASSDVSAFFNKGVSAALRKAALRYVFQQPEFNVRDGLNDYDGDYTVFEPLGDTITSDMKFHAARKEKARLEAEAEAKRAEEDLQKQQEKLEQERMQQEAAEKSDASEQEAPEQTEKSPNDDKSTDQREPPDEVDESDLEDPALQLAEKDDESLASDIFSSVKKDVTESV